VSSRHNAAGTDDLTAIQDELHAFVADELASGPDADAIGPDDDLIQRGIVDSLGVQQVMEFCRSRYGVRVDDADLVPENFKTLRQLAAFVQRKQGERGAPGQRSLRRG
jgi:acyl carrier protein